MSKILAIIGHPTRGKEIIELLKMMGGIADNIQGNVDEQFYYIHEDGYIHTSFNNSPNNNFCKFTLEEFLEKYPFKVGDNVFLYDNITEGCVTGMKWDKNKGVVKYCVYTLVEYWCDAKDMKKNNTALEPEEFESNAIKIVDGKVVDGLEKIHKLGPKSKLSPQYYEKNMNESENTDSPLAPILSNREDYAEGKFGYVIPNGYEFDSIRNNQIIIRPIKPKYPKTHEECCGILGCKANHVFTNFSYNGLGIEISDYENKIDKLLSNFRKLRYCCDAYWKIAGEEMGLGGPWEPDDNDVVYSIVRTKNTLGLSDALWGGNCNLLEFPSEEMRNAFYENFKDLIESCKELL